MAKNILFSGQPAPVGTTDDYLFMLRCDEAAAGNNLLDALGVRDMTQTSSPAVAAAQIGWVEPGAETAGSRDFDGAADYAGRAAADGDEALIQLGHFGFACWFTPATLPSARTLIELGEYSSPETSATNVQFAVHPRSTGSIRTFWEHGSGSNTTTETATGLLVAGVRSHIGVSVGPDPNAHNLWRVRIYHNGACVLQTDGVAPPTGGASARWIVAASRNDGSAVGTPGGFIDGTLDDVLFCKWTPGHEYFRDLYGAGVRDFNPHQPTAASVGGLSSGTFDTFEAYARVLVEIGTAELTHLDRINLTDVSLSDLNGQGVDMVKALEVTEDLDDLMAACSLELHSRFGFYNFSRFAANTITGDDNVNPIEDLIKPMRRVKVEVAIVPAGMQGNGIDPFFQLVFDGFVNAVNTKDQSTSVTMLDRGKALMKTWVEPNETGENRNYGDATATTGVQDWLQQIIDDNEPNRFEILSIDDAGAGATLDIVVFDDTLDLGEGKPHPLETGDSIKIIDSAAADGVYTLSAGTTATTLKTTTAPGVIGASSAGYVKAVDALGYFGGTPDLYVPVSPGWDLYEWTVSDDQSVLTTLDDIAQQIGWRVKSLFDPVRREFRLTLHDPAASLDAGAFTMDKTFSVNQLTSSDDSMRNVGTTEYASQANPDPTLDHKRFIVSAIDSDSVREFGRSYFRVAVGDDSLITRANEAQDFTDKLVHDLSQPEAQSDFVVPIDVSLEPGAKVLTTGEANEAPSFFNHLVSGWVHQAKLRMDPRGYTSSFGILRIADGIGGSGVSKRRAWGEIVNQAGAIPGLGTSRLVTPAAPTCVYLDKIPPATGVRSLHVSWTWPWITSGTSQRGRQYHFTELHMSASSAFTPDASTLIWVGTATAFLLVSNTILGAPAKTYYVRVVHHDTLRNRSAVSGQTAFSY